MKMFSDCGLCVPDILLPAKKDLLSWSVVACDQYTQDSVYWNNVAKAVGNAPSTLNIILPELYLEKPDCANRIAAIRKTMRSYLNDGVFDPAHEGFMYIERTTSYGRKRYGLVCAIDLEAYEWKPGNTALIRATEATIASRIPPRKAIRDGAPLECPHIMLLVNDSERILVEAAGKKAKQNKCAYDGDLMLNSGHIKGWWVSSEEEVEAVHQALLSLKKDNFLFAVGDGNHSLATAKAVWEEYKQKNNVTDSPVRYALVEVVNIYDKGLTFEPIHRVVFNTSIESVTVFLKDRLGGKLTSVSSAEELEKAVHGSTSSFGFVSASSGTKQYKLLETNITDLAVSRLQPLLDEYVSSNQLTIDYIHGSDEVFRLGERTDAVALMLPPVDKDSFFATIASRGALPRKSFSMGEASEKRFYLECRTLFAEEK